jgi:hypothetical protein
MRKKIALLAAVALAVAPSAAVASRHPAADVLKALRNHRLPLREYIVYTETTDVNHLLGRPGQYASKVNFHDARLPKSKDWDIEGGGSIETFRNRADALRRYKYVRGFGTTSLFAEYDYLSGKVLLRLSHVLTPKQAAAYKAALVRVAK